MTNDKRAVFNDLVASLGGRQEFTVFALETLTINGKPISKGCVDKWFSGQLIPDITLALLQLSKD